MTSGIRNPKFEKWSSVSTYENNASFCEDWSIEFAGSAFHLQPLNEGSIRSGVNLRIDDSATWVRLWQRLDPGGANFSADTQLIVTAPASAGHQTPGMLKWIALLATDPNGKRVFYRKLLENPSQLQPGGSMALDFSLEGIEKDRELLLSLHFGGGPGHFSLESITTRQKPAPAAFAGAPCKMPKIASGAGFDEKKVKVCIVSSDMDDVAIGRAVSLAEMAARNHTVELVGPSFTAKNPRPSLDHAPLTRRSFPATGMSSFLEGAIELARNTKCDVVHVVKPRLPGLLIGHLIRRQNNCPMLIDMEGREMASVEPREPAVFDEVLDAAKNDPATFDSLQGDLWTRFAETLLPEAELTTVTNVALQRRFGGLLVRPACDEAVFDPDLYDRDRVREEFGYGPSDRVILLPDAQHRNESIIDVAEALNRVGDPHLALCIIGGVPDTTLAERLRQARVDFHPAQPEHRWPELINLADAVVILHRADDPVVDFRLPNGLADALAMGAPVVAKTSASLKDIALSGVYTPVFNEISLDLELQALTYSQTKRGSVAAARDYFLSEMSYSVNAARLDTAYDAALKRPRCDTPLLDKTLDVLAEKFGQNIETPLRRPFLRREEASRDLVFLWKQNDSDLYGRRSDMLAKQLLRSGKVRRVIHLDAPISLDELNGLAEASYGQQAHQGRGIYSNTVRRILHQADTSDFIRRTFLHRGNAPNARAFGHDVPSMEGYSDFIGQLMKDENIQANPLLWISPIVPDYSTVLEIVKPRLVVADLIDDQRLFPGSSAGYRLRAEKGYEAVLRDADVVFTNCEPLKEAFHTLRPDIHVVPNGCDILPPDVIPDRQVARLPRPIIGYVGNLRDRINLSLLERIAKTYPEGSIVLVGSAHGRPEIGELAERNPNIKLLGIKPYDQAVSIMKAFDVAIMPHLKNEQTDRMNPLKLYVYFAAGAPVVTSEVANIDDLASHVHVARSDDDFLEKLGSVLHGKTPEIQDSSRQAIVENLSWARRVDAMWKVVAPAR